MKKSQKTFFLDKTKQQQKANKQNTTSTKENITKKTTITK